MTNLEKFLERSKELREKAIQTPYKLTCLGSLMTPKGEDFGTLQCSECTRDYILNAVNTGETRDEIIRLMSKAIGEWCEARQCGNRCSCHWCETLDRVEDLAK